MARWKKALQGALIAAPKRESAQVRQLDRKRTLQQSIHDVLNPKCPTQQVLDRIASKWTMLVILALDERPLRFARLQRRVVDVTKKVLTQTLRALERDGLVSRRVFNTVPVQTEYELTDLGRSLAEAVVGIRSWAYANMETIAQARVAFDATYDVAGERASAVGGRLTFMRTARSAIRVGNP